MNSVNTLPDKIDYQDIVSFTYYSSSMLLNLFAVQEIIESPQYKRLLEVLRILS